MNNLKHPNIIKAYEFFFGDTKNAPSILLEYCNHSLESYIKKMNNNERSDAIIDLCNVMKFVHKAGIIHRDLKPSNILINENNKIKLSDFGICGLISNEYETITRTKMMGSMLFMAPELLQGSSDYDEKVDVYAFGVVLYFILTSGQYPSFSLPDIINLKSFSLPNSFSKIRKEILNLCFSPFPEKRPSFEVLYEMIKENISALILG